MIRRLAELTHTDFDEIVPEKVDTVLLPVGTIEAHGCTNLGTDLTIPEFICEQIAEKINAIIAPTISYGVTRTLLAYPGSMTTSPQTFEAYVTDVLTSLFMNGFEKAVIINGHGGNNEHLHKASAQAWQRTGGKSLVIHWWELCAPVTQKIFGQAGAHAGLDETAMVLAADPKLVKPEQCEKIKPYLVRQGAYAYPNPAPILIYKENEGLPVFDEIMARQYANEIIEYIVEFISDVVAKWSGNL